MLRWHGNCKKEKKLVMIIVMDYEQAAEIVKAASLAARTCEYPFKAEYRRLVCILGASGVAKFKGRKFDGYKHASLPRVCVEAFLTIENQKLTLDTKVGIFTGIFPDKVLALFDTLPG